MMVYIVEKTHLTYINKTQENEFTSKGFQKKRASKSKS